MVLKALTPCRKWIGVLASVFFSLCMVINAYSQTRTLNEYLTAGKSRSAALRDYRNQFAALAFDSLRIIASFKPKVDFTGRAMIAPVIGGFGYDSTVTNGADYNALIAASQTLFQGGNQDLQLEKLRAQRQALEATAKIAELDLVKIVTSQYIAAYSNLHALESAEESLRLLDEQKEILKELVKQGVYSQGDYLNLLISRQQQAIALLQIRVQYRTDLLKLNKVSGIVDTSYVILIEPQFPPASSVPIYQSLRARQFQLDSLNLELERSLLDWNYKPKLSWFADAGLMTADLPTVYKYFGFSAGLNFTFPIYDGGQRNLDYEKFNLSLQSNELKSRAFFLETNLQRLIFEDQIRAQDTLIVEYRKQLETIGELLDFQKQQLRQGNLKLTDLLITLNTLNTTRLSMHQAEIARLQSVIELNYLNQ